MQKRAVLVLLLISLLTLIQDVNAQEICNDGIDNDADGYTDCWDYYGTPSECPPDVSCLKASPMCSTSTNKWECPIEFGFFTHVYDYVFDSITYPCVAPLFSHYKADLDEFLVDTQTTPNARIVAFDMPSWSFGPNWFTSDPANGFGADYYFLTAPWYGTFLPGHDDIGDLYDEAIDYANSKGFTVLLAVPFAPSYGVQNQLDSVLKQEFYEFMLHLLNDRGYKNKDIIWHFAVEADIGNFHPDPQRYLCSTQEYINWITDMMQEAKRALNDVGSTQKITPAISMNTASMQTLYSLGYTFVCDPADTRSGEVRGLNFYGGTDCDSYNQASCLDCGPTSTNKGVACVSDIIGIDIGAGSETIINSFADTFGKDVGIWQALLPPPNPTQTQVNQLVDGIYNSKADYMVYYEMRDQDFFDGVCDSISGSDDPEGLKYWNGVKKISYDSMIAKFNQYSSCQNIVTSPTTVYGGGTTTGTVTACCPDLTYCAFNGNCIPRYDSDAGTEACGFDVDSDGDKELCGFGNTFYDQDNYADSLICTECGNTWNGLSGEANCFGDDAIEVTGYSRQTACNQDYSAETNTNCPRTFTGIDCGTNDYPSFSSDTSDTASCTGAGDCVYSSTCYNDNTKQIINGENLFCNNNKWWDFDNRKLACEAQDLCGTYIIGQSRLWKWTKAGEVVGEYDDTVNPECCGDDPNEKFILGSDGTNACCNSATDIVTNGICFEMDPDLSSTECTDGSYNWISRGSQANCCGDDANEFYITGTDTTSACCNSASATVEGGRCILKKSPGDVGYEDGYVRYYQTGFPLTWQWAEKNTNGNGLEVGARFDDCNRFRAWTDFYLPDTEIKDNVYINKAKLTFTADYIDNEPSRSISIRKINKGTDITDPALLANEINNGIEYTQYTPPTGTCSACTGVCSTCPTTTKDETISLNMALSDLKNSLVSNYFSLGFIMPDETCVTSSTRNYISIDSTNKIGSNKPTLKIYYNECGDGDADCNKCTNRYDIDSYGNAWLQGSSWPWPVNPTTVTQGDVSHAYYNWVNNIESCL